MCLETGAYFMNLKGCKECGNNTMSVIDKVSDETDETETVTYTHVCEECGHIIAKHEYEFEIDGDYQKFSMNCMLCGWGEDERSIMPDDPRLHQDPDDY